MKRCQAVLSPARALVAQGGGLQGEGWNEALDKIGLKPRIVCEI